MTTFLRIGLLALALTLVRGVLGAIGAAAPHGLGYYLWLLLADLVIAAVLLAIAERATWRGTRLAMALFVVAFGIGSVGTLIEAVLFKLFPLAGVWRLAASSTIVSAVAASAAAWLGKGGRQAIATPGVLPVWRLVLRFAGCALLYTVCYLAAGIAVLPYVRRFYEAGGLPNAGATMAMQFLVRGPLLVAIAILIVRITASSRKGHALLVAGTMAGLGGIAPLVLPNPFLPDAVRWAHLVEITVSNALFGAIVGWVYSAGAVRNR